MTKNKIHNLLVGSRKIALLAMFAMLPFTTTNATTQQHSSTKTELSEKQLKHREQSKEIAIDAFARIITFFIGTTLIYFVLYPKKIPFSWGRHFNWKWDFIPSINWDFIPKPNRDFVPHIGHKIKEEYYKRFIIRKPKISEEDFAKCPSTRFDTKLQSLFLSYLKINIGSYLQKRARNNFKSSDFENHDFAEEIDNATYNLLTNIQTWLSNQPKNTEIETIKNYVLYMNWKAFLNNCKDAWHPVFVKDKIFSDSGKINKSALEQYIQTSWTNIAQLYKDMIAGMANNRSR